MTRRKGRDFVTGQTWAHALNRRGRAGSFSHNTFHKVGAQFPYAGAHQLGTSSSLWTSGEAGRKCQPSKEVSSKYIQSPEWHLPSVPPGACISRLVTTPPRKGPEHTHPAARPPCYVDWWDRWHHLTKWALLLVNITSKLFICSRKKKKKKACRKYRVSVANYFSFYSKTLWQWLTLKHASFINNLAIRNNILSAGNNSLFGREQRSAKLSRKGELQTDMCLWISVI